ncbi:MAG: flagellar export protein FliJ [Terriglobia bacterium]
MGFQFSLEALLRVRESFEKQQEQKLAAAMAEFKRVNAMRESVLEELKSTADRFTKLLARGAASADLHLLCYEEHLLKRREQALLESISAALAEVKKQRIQLQAAQQKRKILENLRQKQRALYLLTEGRRDQQKLDDTFLLRRNNDDDGKGVA